MICPTELETLVPGLKGFAICFRWKVYYAVLETMALEAETHHPIS